MRKYSVLSESARFILLEADEIDAQVEELADENREVIEETLRLLKEANTLLDVGIEEEDIEKFKHSEEAQELQDEGVLSEAAVLKIDKNSRLQQLGKIAKVKLAKETNDPLFKQYAMYRKKLRFIESKWENTFGQKADILAKKMLKDSLAAK